MKDEPNDSAEWREISQACAGTGRLGHGRICSVPDGASCLDPTELAVLERNFRQWAASSARLDVQASRRRILLIFLLIRFTGARLNEILSLDPAAHIDFDRHTVRLSAGRNAAPQREVQIPPELSEEIKAALAGPSCGSPSEGFFQVDPGHVRRKFYERAGDCGFPRELGAPTAIRKARAVELMRGNMPLPVVQRMLGHSTPGLTAAYVDFSDEEMSRVARYFIEKESRRKTSARNTFFGKIKEVVRGDIQSRVDLAAIGGYTVTTIITNDSLTRLGLQPGSLVTAEVKAPWVILQKNGSEPECTAENRFRGVITRIIRGKLTTEYTVRVSDDSELCSIGTYDSRSRLDFQENEEVWAMFNSFSVILHVD